MLREAASADFIRVSWRLVGFALFLLWGCESAPVGPPQVASVTIKPPSATIATGSTIQLTATVLANGGAQLDRAVTWDSSDSSVASVSASGLVSGLGTGGAHITATSMVRTGIQAISGGGFHTCQVMIGGAASCWGRADSGQLGNGS